ncbi:MAG: helix-hairpin-helix domain-containing protein [Campylobacteraceae bacterium]|nr:helix-hairpin-helix domain-containing protein [Campylobacteraceae bacterium]
MRKIFISLVVSAVCLFALDINTATKDEFAAIKGIGDKKAEDIVKYRSEVGGFKSDKDILKVKGIGEKTLENIKNDVKDKAKSPKADKAVSSDNNKQPKADKAPMDDKLKAKKADGEEKVKAVKNDKAINDANATSQKVGKAIK